MMKRFMAVGIASIAMLAAVTLHQGAQGQPSAKNLVQNGSAEIGADGSPQDWSKAVFPPAMSLDSVEYIWHAKTAHSGKRSLCFKKTESRFFPVAQWSQTIPYTGDARQVAVSVWIKARAAGKATLTISCRSADGESLSRGFAAQINGNGGTVTQDWKQYKSTVTVPSGTREIVVAPEMYGPGVVWFDDISVTPVSAGETGETGEKG